MVDVEVVAMVILSLASLLDFETEQTPSAASVRFPDAVKEISGLPYLLTSIFYSSSDFEIQLRPVGVTLMLCSLSESVV